MGAFNTLSIEWLNTKSGKKFDVVLQFKYGEVWQYEYKIGDVLKWGDVSEGDRFAREVLIEAIVENDFEENGLPEYFEILLKDNVITEVRPLSDTKKYWDAGRGFIVLK
jgi:hypothetical protein